MNGISFWLPLLVMVKLLFYSSAAVTLAGTYFLWRERLPPALLDTFRRYSLWACGIGLVTAIIGFFLQVGQFADNGMAGMFDTSMMTVLWLTPLGTNFQMQLVAGVIVGLLLLFNAQKHHARRYAASFVIALIIPLSLVLVGHTVELNWSVRIGLGFHVVIGLWWMGSLLYLWRSCSVLAVHDLKNIMRNFGRTASLLMPVLLVAGLGIAYVLSGSLNQLLYSTHGQFLLLKILFVVCLLGIAALNKLQLVPHLSSAGNVQYLQRSILFEGCIGFVLLITTAILSTALTPAVMS